MKLAIIRIRGEVNVNRKVEETLRHLGADKKNSCVIVEDNGLTMGMIKKAKDYITWGPVSDDVVKQLEKKTKKGKRYLLNSPRKGYGRKGIKVAFARSGALGNRGDKINDLLKRML